MQILVGSDFHEVGCFFLQFLKSSYCFWKTVLSLYCISFRFLAGVEGRSTYISPEFWNCIEETCGFTATNALIYILRIKTFNN